MKAFSCLLVGAVLAISAVTALATTYSGNGGTGFGGAVGTGMLAITFDGTNVDFTFTRGTIGGTGLFNDSIVLYVDSVSGGVNNTSTFTDNGDGGREAVSGVNNANGTRTLDTFAPGFFADYAILVQNGFAGLFDLSNPSNFTFVNGTNNNLSGNNNDASYSFVISRTALGLPATGGGFTFEGTYISNTAFRSNETFGASTTQNVDNNGNAGATGTQTFTAANISGVPEPGTWACMGFGTVALLAMNRTRARRA